MSNATLAEQLEHSKKTSLVDGSFDEKGFKNKTTRLFRLLPFLFDSDGRPRFQDFKTERPAIATRIRAATPQELDNGYGDLYQEHLVKVVEAVAAKPGLGQLKVLFESTRNQFIAKDVKKILTPVNDSGKASEERTLILESLPASVALFRGCYGGDCSLLSVPFHPLLKNTRAYFIRKSDGPTTQPVGYLFVAEAEVGDKTLPYIITANGATLTKADVEMAVRLVAEDYKTDAVLLPDFGKNPHLVNTDAARQGMKPQIAKKVTVAMPAGWDIVDAYAKHYNQTGYTNYYDASHLKSATLATLPKQDKRIIGQVEHAYPEAPRYHEVRDLLSIPTMERAVLGAQALSDQGGKVTKKDVLTHLSLTEGEVSAAEPLLQLSSKRPLKFAEYDAAKARLGYNLKDILKLDVETRAATFKSLYEEAPRLFDEDRKSVTGRYVEALTAAYAPKQTELAKKIIEAQDLTGPQALALLRSLKGAMQGDLGLVGQARLALRGKTLESEIISLLRSSFLDGMYAQTRAGSKLIEGLHSNDALVQDFIRNVLETETHPKAQQFPVLSAIREIEKLRTKKDVSSEEAEREWLASSDVAPEKKAAVLALELTSPKFDELERALPAEQVPRVREAIAKRSHFFAFRDLAKTPADRAKLAQTRLESFEFEAQVFPKEGKKVTLGSPPTEEGRAGDEEQSEVTVTKSFAMQATATTNYQYAAYLKATGKDSQKLRALEAKDPNEPVVEVDWNEANEFAKWLSEQDPTHHYRLPTEAEWEYAARGGTSTRYSFGDNAAELGEYAWTHENSGGKIHRVAELKPNPFGLYDMHGNQWEWAGDWYGNKPPYGVDPTGPASGKSRVIRGGGWGSLARNARSAYRGGCSPSDRNDGIGFRLVRTPK